jgi:hypothetical protein
MLNHDADFSTMLAITATIFFKGFLKNKQNVSHLDLEKQIYLSMDINMFELCLCTLATSIPSISTVV